MHCNKCHKLIETLKHANIANSALYSIYISSMSSTRFLENKNSHLIMFEAKSTLSLVIIMEIKMQQ